MVQWISFQRYLEKHVKLAIPEYHMRVPTFFRNTARRRIPFINIIIHCTFILGTIFKIFDAECWMWMFWLWIDSILKAFNSLDDFSWELCWIQTWFKSERKIACCHCMKLCMKRMSSILTMLKILTKYQAIFGGAILFKHRTFYVMGEGLLIFHWESKSKVYSM